MLASVAAAVDRQTKPVSFADFADNLKISKPMRGAFRRHVRDDGPCNYRSEDQWQRLYQEFVAKRRM